MAVGGLLANAARPQLLRGLLNLGNPTANTQAPRQGGGLLDRYGQFTQDNWESLLFAGLGSMSPTAAGSQAGMMQGLQTGAAMSDRRRTRQDERAEREKVEEERRATRQALAAALGQYEGELDPATMALMEASPEWGMEWLGKRMTPAAQPTPTDDMREYAQAQMQGFDGTLQDWIGATRSPGVTVNNGPERAYDRTIGEADAKLFTGINDEAVQAQNAMNSLSIMEQAMQDPNFYSGAGAGPVQAFKRGLVALGWAEEDAAAPMEAFQSQAANSALAALGGSLGTGFSNADRDFVMSTVPGLQNTPDGNRQLITINRKIAERKLQIANLARAYAQSHGGRLDASGFQAELAQWAQQNPLFAQSPFSGGAGEGAPAGSPQPPPGVPPDVWQFMTPEERNLWQR